MLRAYCPIAVVVISATDIPIKTIMINIDEVSSYLCCVLRNSSAFSPAWTPFEISDFPSTICMFSVLHITLVLCLVLFAGFFCLSLVYNNIHFFEVLFGAHHGA